MHDTRSYFVNSVIPAQHAFAKTYADRKVGRRMDTIAAAQFAETLLNLSEHVYKEFPAAVAGFRKLHDYRRSVWSKCPDYHIACDIANAASHRDINDPDRTIDNIKAVVEHYTILRYKDDAGYYYSSGKALVINTKDGRLLDLFALLFNTFRYWEDELLVLGVIERPSWVMEVKTEYQPREIVAAVPPIRVIGRVGKYMEIGPMCFDVTKEQGMVGVHAFEVPKVLVTFEILESPFSNIKPTI
jgi:hypothetical protein